MTPAATATVDTTAQVVSTTEVADAFFQTRLQAPGMVVLPGQFVQLRPRPRAGVFPYLRMPLSVAAVDAQQGTIDVLYETVGPKTTALRQLAEGAEVGLLGPIGNSFPAPQSGITPILVGGGIGVPPLIYFGCSLRNAGHDPRLVVGARTAGKHLPDSLLLPAGQVQRATDDGTLGHAGLVTDLLRDALSGPELSLNGGPSTMVYTCGPHGMMAAVAALCAEYNVECFASLEEYMACGFGVCVGCVVERADTQAQKSAYGHYARVCVDGPVFDARQIAW